MAQKFNEMLQSVNNSEIRITLEKIFAILGLSRNSAEGDSIPIDVTGDVTGNVTGDVVGDVTGDLAGDVIAESVIIRNAPVGSGGLSIKQLTNSVTLTAIAAPLIDINIPAGAIILGTQLIVISALAGGETWDAAYKTGATAALATAAAVAVNTKLNVPFDANAATAITSGVTDIEITKNGGGSFTAQGSIRAITYYLDFETITDV